MLRATLGFNYEDFYNIITYIAEKRLTAGDKNSHASTDLSAILNVVRQMSKDVYIQYIKDIDLNYWTTKLQTI